MLSMLSLLATDAKRARFGMSFWLLGWLKQDFRREVEKELRGREEEPSELIYFKIYKSQIRPPPERSATLPWRCCCYCPLGSIKTGAIRPSRIFIFPCTLLSLSRRQPERRSSSRSTRAGPWS